jgi:hypothetical protein
MGYATKWLTHLQGKTDHEQNHLQLSQQRNQHA